MQIDEKRNATTGHALDKELERVFGELRVECRDGLVGENDVGLLHERAGNGRTLFLSP